MNRILTLVAVILMTLAIATPAFAISVTVENNCDQEVYYDSMTRRPVDQGVTEQKFYVVSSRFLFFLNVEETVTVNLGESKTVNLPAGACLSHIEDIYRNRHYCSTFLGGGFPCCWNVTYEVTSSERKCGRVSVK